MKTGYTPVSGDSYISGPGCYAASSWGWTLIIVLGVAGLLYVGGGIGFGVKIQGAAPGIAAHPHADQWKQTGGLVVDGVVFTRAHVEAKIKGEAVVLPSAGTGAKEKQASKKDADCGDGETGGLLKDHATKENYGAAGTRVDSAAFAAAAAEEDMFKPDSKAAGTSSSEDDLVE